MSRFNVTLWSDAFLPRSVALSLPRLVSPRPLSIDPRRARTRGVILAAAREAWAEGGLETTTIAQIARRAGVAVGSIYGHFGSKELLALALVDETLSARDAEFAEAGAATAPESRVAALGAACVRLAIEEPIVFRVLVRRSLAPVPEAHPFDPVDPAATRALRRLDGILHRLRDDLDEALRDRTDVSVPVVLASLLALWWGLAGLATRQDGEALGPEVVTEALGLGERLLQAPAP